MTRHAWTVRRRTIRRWWYRVRARWSPPPVSPDQRRRELLGAVDPVSVRWLQVHHYDDGHRSDPR